MVDEILNDGHYLLAQLEGTWPELSPAPLDRVIARVRDMTAATWQADQAAILAALDRLRPLETDLGGLAEQRATVRADAGLTEASAGLVARLGYMPPGARRWAEQVAQAVHGRPEATTAGVLTLLGELVERQNAARVGSILRAFGWRRERVGSGARRSYRYLPPLSIP